MQHLSPDEQLLVTSFRIGRVAEFDHTPNSPRATVRADVVRSLLLNQHEYSSGVPPEGVRITGANISGNLDISELHGPGFTPLPQLILRDCVIASGVTLDNTQIARLVISNCAISGLSAKNCHVFGPVDLTDTHPVVDEAGSASTLEIDFSEATIDGSISAGRLIAIAEPQQDPNAAKRYALSFSGTKIFGSLDLEPAIIAVGGILISYATISGDVWLSGAFASCLNDSYALRATGLRVGGMMSIGRHETPSDIKSLFFGDVMINNSNIGQNVDGFGIAVCSAIHLSQSPPKGGALRLARSQAAGVSLSNSRFDAGVDLTGLRVSAGIQLIGLNLPHAGTSGIEITHLARAPRNIASQFHVSAPSTTQQIIAAGANVGHDLRIIGSVADLIDLSNTTIGSNMDVTRAELGRLTATNASINGDLLLRQLRSVRGVDLFSISVKRDAIFTDVLLSKGALILSNASINGSLAFETSMRECVPLNYIHIEEGPKAAERPKKSRLVRTLYATIQPHLDVDIYSPYTGCIFLGGLLAQHISVGLALRVANSTFLGGEHAAVALDSAKVNGATTIFNSVLLQRENAKGIYAAVASIGAATLSSVSIQASFFAGTLNLSACQLSSLEVIATRFDGRLRWPFGCKRARKPEENASQLKPASIFAMATAVAGSIDVNFCHLGGSLEFGYSTVKRNITIRNSSVITNAPVAVSCIGASIEGGFGLHNCKYVVGGVNLRAAKIGMTCEILYSRIIADHAAPLPGVDHSPFAALDAAMCRVGSSLSMGRLIRLSAEKSTPSLFRGHIIAPSATISSSVFLHELSIVAPRPLVLRGAYYNDGPVATVDLSNSRVERDVFLAGALSSDGVIFDLQGISSKKIIYWTADRFSESRVLSMVAILRYALLFKDRIFRRRRGVLLDSTPTKTKPGFALHLITQAQYETLDGVSLTRIGRNYYSRRANDTARDRLDWIENRSVPRDLTIDQEKPEFYPHVSAYAKLASYFYENNQLGDARSVEIAERRMRRRAGYDGPLRPFTALSDICTGYGRSPVRAFLSLIALGTLVCIANHDLMQKRLLQPKADAINSRLTFMPQEDAANKSGGAGWRCDSLSDAILYTVDSALTVVPQRWSPGVIGIRGACTIRTDTAEGLVKWLPASIQATKQAQFRALSLFVSFSSYLTIAMVLAFAWTIRTRLRREK